MIRDRLDKLREKANLGNVTSVHVEDESAVAVDAEDIFKLLTPVGVLYNDFKKILEDIQNLQLDLDDRRNKEKFEDKSSDIKRRLHILRRDVTKATEVGAAASHLLAHLAASHRLSLGVWMGGAVTALAEVLAVESKRQRTRLENERLITAGPAAEQDESSALLTRPAEVFTQDLLTETRQAVLSLNAVQEREEQVKRIEGSIHELNQMFQDLALHVSAHGESIDRIEGHVYEARIKTEHAAVEMFKAEKKAHSARKKKCCLITVLTSVAIVLLVLIVWSAVYG